MDSAKAIKPIVMMYARGLWRRRWYAVAVAWLFCLLGWSYVAYMPNIYEGKTRIYVDTNSVLRPLLQGIAIDSNVMNDVDLMTRTLFSRPNLEKVAHASDLDLDAKTPDALDQVVEDLRKQTTITEEGRNLFTIAYQDSDRNEATKVVQAFLNVFVDSNIGSSRQDMNNARSFIDQQLAAYSRQLDAAEKSIADFKASHVGYLPGENNYATKLQNARDDLTTTQANIQDTLQQRTALQQQLANTPQSVETVSSGPTFGAGPPVGGETGSVIDPNLRVMQIEQKLDDLRQTYTDEYPDIIRLKKELAQAKLSAQRAASGPPIGPRVLGPNPVYEQLTLQLVALDTNLAKLRSQVERDQGEIAKWEELAKSVPEVGAELAKLTRNYDVIRKSYEDLLSRSEAAKIGNDVQTQTQTVKFRVIDPPITPPVPVAPRRGLFLSLVLLVGVAAGVAFAFVLAQVDDSVKSLSDLREFMTIPILGAISMVTVKVQEHRYLRPTTAFALSCVALVATYVGILSLVVVRGA